MEETFIKDFLEIFASEFLDIRKEIVNGFAKFNFFLITQCRGTRR